MTLPFNLKTFAFGQIATVNNEKKKEESKKAIEDYSEEEWNSNSDSDLDSGSDSDNDGDGDKNERISHDENGMIFQILPNNIIFSVLITITSLFRSMPIICIYYLFVDSVFIYLDHFLVLFL